MVARRIIHRCDLDKLLQKIDDYRIIRIFIDVHITRNRNDIGIQIANAFNQLGILGAILVQVQVGQFHNAQIAYVLIGLHTVKRRDKGLIEPCDIIANYHAAYYRQYRNYGENLFQD